jgi:hypothetical protein
MPTAPSLTPIYDQLADESGPGDNQPDPPVDPEIRVTTEDE